MPGLSHRSFQQADGKRVEMTIKIERDAVLQILNGEPPSNGQASTTKLPRAPCIDDAEIVVYSPKDEAPVLIPTLASCCFGHEEPLRLSTPDLVDSDVESYFDDDCSFDEPLSSLRRVSFAQPLITEVRTRPRTLPQDLRSLFYTYEETHR